MSQTETHIYTWGTLLILLSVLPGEKYVAFNLGRTFFGAKYMFLSETKSLIYVLRLTTHENNFERTCQMNFRKGDLVQMNFRKGDLVLRISDYETRLRNPIE